MLGWTSRDYPWVVIVTVASADTLTWGGGVGGHPGTIRGWSYIVPWAGECTHWYPYCIVNKELCHPRMTVDCLRQHWTGLEFGELEYRHVLHVQFAKMSGVTPYTPGIFPQGQSLLLRSYKR